MVLTGNEDVFDAIRLVRAGDSAEKNPESGTPTVEDGFVFTIGNMILFHRVPFSFIILWSSDPVCIEL